MTKKKAAAPSAHVGRGWNCRHQAPAYSGGLKGRRVSRRRAREQAAVLGRLECDALS